MVSLRRSSSSQRGASRQASARPRREWRWRLPKRGVRVALLSVVVLVGIAGVLTLSGVIYPLLDRPLTKVSVTSKLAHLPSAEVEQALASLLGQHFFSLDIERMQENLVALPWVAKANVSRRWPDQLLVEITEQQPLARWGEVGLLNLDGELFMPRSIRGFDLLPQLVGPSGTEAYVMEQFHELGYLLRPLGVSVTQLRLSDRNTWSLRLGKVQIEVGGEDVALRLKRFVWLYQQKLKECWSDVERVDLRYDNGVAVRHGNACAV